MINFFKKNIMKTRESKINKLDKSKKSFSVVIDCSRTTSQWYKEYGRCLGGVDQYHRLSFLGIKFIGCENELEEIKSSFQIIHNITIVNNVVYGSIHNLNKFLYYCGIYKISNYVVLSIESVIAYIDPNYACDRYGVYPYCDIADDIDITNSLSKYIRIPILFNVEDSNKSLALELSEDYVRTDKGIVVSLPLIPAIELSDDIDFIKESIYKILSKSYDSDEERGKKYDETINELIRVSTPESILECMENMSIKI